MIRTARLLAGSWLAAALVLASAGCGSDPSGPGGLGDEREGSQPAAAVTVERNGGLAGVHESFEVVAGDPGADDVLELAAERADEVAATGDVTVPCCDRFGYDVTVRLADGSTVHGTTYDGDDSAAHEVAMAVLALHSSGPARR
jgi:hypothetical protein